MCHLGLEKKSLLQHPYIIFSCNIEILENKSYSK